MSSGASATKPQPPPPPSPPPGTESSLDGLQFGKKIYFEDAAGGLAAAQAKPKKGRGGGAAAAQPLRCQVEGCNADLRDAKAYYSRHKVCDMHSKSPSVIVAGLDQRFCQQCSRFHQLPEFDQGKRSCRRRLANHNERRRKPPTGSLLTSRYARLSSPIFGNNGRGGGFVKDFAPHPKLTLGNALPCEPVPGIQTITLPWQANSQAPSDFFLQDSVGGTSFLGPRHLPVEGYSTQVTDSSCALSLLSNQTWGSKNTTPSVELNNLLNFNGTLMTQLAAASSHQVAGIHHLPNSSWYFKGVDSGNCSPNEFVPDLGLGPGELDVGKSGACDSPHWSL